MHFFFFNLLPWLAGGPFFIFVVYLSGFLYCFDDRKINKRSHFQIHLVVHLQPFREFPCSSTAVLLRRLSRFSCSSRTSPEPLACVRPSDVLTQVVEVLPAWNVPRGTARSSAGRPQRLFVCPWAVGRSPRLTASAWILHISYWVVKDVSRGKRWADFWYTVFCCFVLQATESTFF